MRTLRRLVRDGVRRRRADFTPQRHAGRILLIDRRCGRWRGGHDLGGAMVNLVCGVMSAFSRGC